MFVIRIRDLSDQLADVELDALRIEYVYFIIFNENIIYIIHTSKNSLKAFTSNFFMLLAEASIPFNLD